MKRMHYFDMLKGIAIFMVVMGHVIAFCVREIDRTFLFKVIEQTHMPLFFFISGWFTYRMKDGVLSMPKIGQRALQLLLPMLVVSTVWIWYFPHSGLQSPLDSTFHGLWFDTYKNGYWFTPVLFVLIAIYCAIVPLLRRFKGFTCWIAVMTAVYLVICAVSTVIPAGVRGLVSIDLIVTSYPAFVFGILASRHREAFYRVTESPLWFTVCLVLTGVLVCVISSPWKYPLVGQYPRAVDMVLRPLYRICLAVVAVAVVRPWGERAFVPDVRPLSNGIARIWDLLGRKSLSIYLLHYFLLFPLTGCREALISTDLSLVPMIFFTGVVAACIIAIVLLVDAVIQHSPLLALLLTGTLSKKKK